LTLRIRAIDVSRDLVPLVERHIHALPYPSQRVLSRTTQSEQQCVWINYLVEFPIPAIEHHLEGNIGPVLNTWDSRSGRIDTDASRRARSSEIIDDELVPAGGSVEVVKGLGGGRGR
jgi:hypothetical protein